MLWGHHSAVNARFRNSLQIVLQSWVKSKGRAIDLEDVQLEIGWKNRAVVRQRGLEVRDSANGDRGVQLKHSLRAMRN
jgi:hypothetical protein